MEHRKNEHSLIFKGFARFWCQTQDCICVFNESQVIFFLEYLEFNAFIINNLIINFSIFYIPFFSNLLYQNSYIK